VAACVFVRVPPQPCRRHNVNSASAAEAAISELSGFKARPYDAKAAERRKNPKLCARRASTRL